MVKALKLFPVFQTRIIMNELWMTFFILSYNFIIEKFYVIANGTIIFIQWIIWDCNKALLRGAGYIYM